MTPGSVLQRPGGHVRRGLSDGQEAAVQDRAPGDAGAKTSGGSTPGPKWLQALRLPGQGRRVRSRWREVTRLD